MIGDSAGDKAVDRYNGDTPIVTRELAHDYEREGVQYWAWRYAPERCDSECHHPVHGFGAPRGLGHLGWFTPGTSELVSVEEWDGHESD